MPLKSKDPFLAVQQGYEPPLTIQSLRLHPRISASDVSDVLLKNGYEITGERDEVNDFQYFDTQGGALFKDGMHLRRKAGDHSWQLLSSGAIKVEEGEGAGFPEHGPIRDAVSKKGTVPNIVPLLNMREGRKEIHIKHRTGEKHAELALWSYLFFDMKKKIHKDGLTLITTGPGTDGQEALYVLALLRNSLGISHFSGDILAFGLTEIRRPLPGAAMFREFAINGNDSVETAGRKILARQAYRMWANVEGTIENTDIEYLHDLRVATRRARFALRFLSAILGEEACVGLREELKWVAGILGRVRDWDVFKLKLPGMMDQIAVSAETAEKVSARVGDFYERDRKILVRSLRSKRFHRIMDGIKDQAFRRDNAGPERSGIGTIAFFAGRLIEKNMKRTMKRLDRGDRIFADEELHRLRIDFKRLRYGMEFFYGLLQGDIRQNIETLVSLQDCLGEHQDAVTAMALMYDLALSAGKRKHGDVFLALGALMQVQKQASDDRRNEFTGLLPKFFEMADMW